MKITWKPIPGFDAYEVSDHGEVRSIDRYITCKNGAVKFLRGVTLRQFINPTGYRHVCLSKDGKIHGFLVHRLVMLAFVGPSDLEVNHIDLDKENNTYPGNLEYCTHTQNMRHARTNGIELIQPRFGFDNHITKLSEDDVRAIRDSNEPGIRLAERYGVSPSLVSMVRNGKIRQMVA